MRQYGTPCALFRDAPGLHHQPCRLPRCSPTLKASALVWDDNTIDEYLKDPQHFIPGNTFPGIKDAQQRADLLAFPREATQPGRAPSSQSAEQGGMGGMLGSRAAPDLKGD